jgi:hypothetical protein
MIEVVLDLLEEEGMAMGHRQEEVGMMIAVLLVVVEVVMEDQEVGIMIVDLLLVVVVGIMTVEDPHRDEGRVLLIEVLLIDMVVEDRDMVAVLVVRS